MEKITAKVIRWTIFILYMAVALYFLFFAGEMGRSHLKEDYTYNLELFKEITRFIKWGMRDETGFKAMLVNVVGNVVCFVPFGILLPMNVKKTSRFISIFLLTFMVSLIIETIQLITRTGSFDVDDILLNTLGGVIGYIIYALTLKIKHRRKA